MPDSLDVRRKPIRASVTVKLLYRYIMNIKIICKVRDLRKEQQLTQEDLAKRLGISRQSLISLESGRSLPSLPLAFGLGDIFNKSVEEIFANNFNRDIVPAIRKEKLMNRNLMPWRSFGLGRMFDEDFLDEDPLNEIKSFSRTPIIDVYENASNVVVESQLPGFTTQDVKIEVADDHIAISGEKKLDKEEKDKNYYLKESTQSTFARVISLPVRIDPEKAKASTVNGILKITLPKAEVKKRKELKIEGR